MQLEKLHAELIRENERIRDLELQRNRLIEERNEEKVEFCLAILHPKVQIVPY